MVESAAVASPDPIRGHVVKALVVLTTEYMSKVHNSPGKEYKKVLIAELQDHVKSETAPYKYPRKIQFVDSLPKTMSGKIRRAELRDLEMSAAENRDFEKKESAEDIK